MIVTGSLHECVSERENPNTSANRPRLAVSVPGRSRLGRFAAARLTR